MAARREVSSKGKVRSSRKARVPGKVSTALPESKNGSPGTEADFLPPGFSLEELKASEANGELTTYFLHTEKRGLARYLPAALKHFQRGFRAVLVTKVKLVFDQRNARVAGRLSGDHFEDACVWAKRTVIDDLQDRYVLGGGGTSRERARTARRFAAAMKARDDLEERRKRAEEELEQASIELVLRFGRKSYPLDGVTLDASHGPGDKVYWRARGGKQSAGAEVTRTGLGE